MVHYQNVEYYHIRTFSPKDDKKLLNLPFVVPTHCSTIGRKYRNYSEKFKKWVLDPGDSLIQSAPFFMLEEGQKKAQIQTLLITGQHAKVVPKSQVYRLWYTVSLLSYLASRKKSVLTIPSLVTQMTVVTIR